MPLYLAAARHQARLSQKDAAEKLGISKNTLSNYELYKTKPGMEMGQRIASLYGMTVDEIKWSED